MNADFISQSILDEIEDVVYISDPKTYELYYMNAMTKRALGNPSEEEWRRKKCYKVLQGLDAPCPFCTNGMLSGDKFYNWEHYNSLLEKHFFIQDKLVSFDGVEARLEVAKDITSQKLLEMDLVKKLEEQRVLNNCIALLHTADNPQDSIQKLLGLVADYHKAERGYIFLLSEDGNFVSNSHEWCAEGIEPQIDVLQHIDYSMVTHWFDKYRTEGEFYIDSLGEEMDRNSEEYEILAAQGIQSLVTAPLYNIDGSFKGFLGLDNSAENIKETAVIRAISNFVSDFLDKSAQMETLYRVSYFDNLTGMQNRHSYSLKIASLEEKVPHALGVIYVDINGLKAINDKLGHKEGDVYINTLGSFLRALYDDCAYRIGGDEFVMLCPEKDYSCFENKKKQLLEFIHRGEFPCAAMGYCWREGDCNVIEQIEIADRLMYKNKEEQYNEFGGKSDLFRHKYLVDAAHHDQDMKG